MLRKTWEIYKMSIMKFWPIYLIYGLIYTVAGAYVGYTNAQIKKTTKAIEAQHEALDKYRKDLGIS